MDYSKLKSGDTFVGEKTGKSYVFHGMNEDGTVNYSDATADAPQAAAPEKPAAKVSKLTGRPQKGYESESLDFLLPENPSDWPNLSATIKSAGDVVDAVKGVPGVMAKGIVDNPATAAVGLVPGLGVPASMLVAAGGQVIDKFVTPIARNVIERAGTAVGYDDDGVAPLDLPDTLPELNAAAGETALTMAGAGLFPNVGGTSVMKSKPNMLPVSQFDVPVLGLPVGEKPSLPGRILKRADAVADKVSGAAFDNKLPVSPETSLEWYGIPLEDIPEDDAGIMSVDEIRRLGIEGMSMFDEAKQGRDLGPLAATPGQMGSDMGTQGDNIRASSFATRRAVDEKVDLQEKNLNNRARAAGGTEAENPEVIAEPVGKQLDEERSQIRAQGAASEREGEVLIETASKRLDAAQADLEKTVERLSSPDVPANVAGQQLKDAVGEYTLKIKDEQNQVRESALKNNLNEDREAIHDAARETAKAIRQILVQNNMVKNGKLVPASETVTRITPKVADYLKNRLEKLDIPNLPPKILEDLRQEIGSMESEAAQEAALYPTRQNQMTVSALGELYSSLKEVQMSMYDMFGQQYIRRADDVFKKNIDVLQGLDPFLNRTEAQRVPDLLFSKGKLEAQNAAKKAAPAAFEEVRLAKQAELIRQSKGDVAGIEAKTHALGADTAKFFDQKPITDVLTAKNADIEAAAGGVEVAKDTARTWKMLDGEFVDAFERRYGQIPGLKDPSQPNLSKVTAAFGSRDVNKVNALLDLTERSTNPEAFEGLRAAWLYEQFKESASFRQFETRLSKAGPETLSKYFDAPGYVELTNRFRLLAATRDRVKSSIKFRSVGSGADKNSLTFALVFAPTVGKLLSSKGGAKFFDAIGGMATIKAVDHTATSLTRSGGILSMPDVLPELTYPEMKGGRQ